VRKDFVGQMHRFMASLVETSYQARGKTMLYLPPEPLPADAAVAAADKDLVQRLEATVIHWTRQVRCVRRMKCD
jgi:dynein heavy chain